MQPKGQKGCDSTQKHEVLDVIHVAICIHECLLIVLNNSDGEATKIDAAKGPKRMRQHSETRGNGIIPVLDVIHVAICIHVYSVYLL